MRLRQIEERLDGKNGGEWLSGKCRGMTTLLKSLVGTGTETFLCRERNTAARNIEQHNAVGIGHHSDTVGTQGVFIRTRETSQ